MTPKPDEGVTLPPLSKPITTSKHWDGGIEWALAGERAARMEREDQLLHTLQQLANQRKINEGRLAINERRASEIEQLEQQLETAKGLLREVSEQCEDMFDRICNLLTDREGE